MRGDLTDVQRCNYALVCTKNMLLAPEKIFEHQMFSKSLKERSGLAGVTDSSFSSFPYLISSWSLNLDLSLG